MRDDRGAAVRKLVGGAQANTCYFRTAAGGDGRKALLQITERCNLHCAHCFVSATRHGADLSLEVIRDRVLPRLVDARVRRLTLTGGEPFVHPQILEICSAAVDAGLSVGLCTNATCVSDEQIARLAELPGVHVNVSFDGFRAESHGRFRGNPASFDVTVRTTRRIADAGLLQGLLSTPNALTKVEDYRQLCAFATAVGADYVLMNPLSAFGRGVRSQRRLAADEQTMNAILQAARDEAGQDVEIVPIRFPNTEGAALAPCIAGDIIYVFTDGAVAVCPYLVFAARSPASRHADTEFLVANILDEDIAQALDRYTPDQLAIGADPICGSCALSSGCGRGCPAAAVAAGGVLGTRDRELCPIE
jgi:radical SAM protein with 4Fe4S-binding SPASM domain